MDYSLAETSVQFGSLLLINVFLITYIDKRIDDHVARVRYFLSAIGIITSLAALLKVNASGNTESNIFVIYWSIDLASTIVGLICLFTQHYFETIVKSEKDKQCIIAILSLTLLLSVALAILVATITVPD